MSEKPSSQRSAWIDHTSLPVRLIERHQLAVELAEEDLAVANADAAIRPAAAHGADLGIETRLVFPHDRARVHADREHVVGARDDVDNSVVHDRLRFARILRPAARPVQARAPHAFELCDVAAIDRGQRGIALVVEVAAIRRPAALRRRRQRCRCERRGVLRVRTWRRELRERSSEPRGGGHRARRRHLGHRRRCSNHRPPSDQSPSRGVARSQYNRPALDTLRSDV